MIHEKLLIVALTVMLLLNSECYMIKSLQVNVKVQYNLKLFNPCIYRQGCRKQGSRHHNILYIKEFMKRPSKGSRM
jgi:hypothetical protein